MFESIKILEIFQNKSSIIVCLLPASPGAKVIYQQFGATWCNRQAESRVICSIGCTENCQDILAIQMCLPARNYCQLLSVSRIAAIKSIFYLDYCFLGSRLCQQFCFDVVVLLFIQKIIIVIDILFYSVSLVRVVDRIFWNSKVDWKPYYSTEE